MDKMRSIVITLDETNKRSKSEQGIIWCKTRRNQENELPRISCIIAYYVSCGSNDGVFTEMNPEDFMISILDLCNGET